jgi:uracil-DNA glycosylase family 4
MSDPASALRELEKQVISCARCPRLVAWREQVAKDKVRRFAGDEYWGRPVPSLGHADARLLVIGLAPAAHGGNRTGRIFTGDRSGDWLYRALHRAGFANQPLSTHRNDGLRLIDCYITAVAHCAPPANKLLNEEIAACNEYLLQELELLTRARVVVALGRIAFDASLAAIGFEGLPPKRKPQFAHGAELNLRGARTLIASFHPSQQNTFTGKLTEQMLDAVFERARSLIAPGLNTD